VNEPILIVDDDLALAQAITTVLKQRQLRVEHCSTAEGAIELVRAKRYPVVVLDLRLGESASGIYVVDAIRKLPADDRPLVLMITAAGLEYLRGIDRQVVAAVVLKPLDLELFGDYVSATYTRAMRDRPAPAVPAATKRPRTMCGCCGSEIPPWVSDIAALPASVDANETFTAWLSTECRTCGSAPSMVGGRTELVSD
jgi:DNA-binding response OmpR family regulator